jgi:hypothetical protein
MNKLSQPEIILTGNIFIINIILYTNSWQEEERNKIPDPESAELFVTATTVQ